MPDSLDELGTLIAHRRAELHLSLREASAASGVPVATLARVEQGRMPDLGTFRRLIEWLGLPSERFFEQTQRTESTPEVIGEQLRSDPALPPEAADRIAAVVRDLYASYAVADRRLAVHLRAAKTFTPPALRLLTDLLDEMQSALEARYRE
jgi:transcriptional regulator with XRE-family HTH domain